MKTETRNSAELTKFCKLIKDMPVGMLISPDAGGAMASRPMSPLEMDSKGALWFLTDLRFDRIGHLRAANLSFMDEFRGTYVSLSGCGEISTDQAHISRLWTAFARPWFPDGPESPNLVLLKFVPYAAKCWDVPHGKMFRMFAMVASVIASKPLGFDDHHTFVELSNPSRNIHSSIISPSGIVIA